MSELAVSNVSSSSSNSNSSTGSNKRKRRSSVSEVDIENQRPSKKTYVPSADAPDSEANSDIENGSNQIEYSSLGGSPKRHRGDTISNAPQNNSASRSITASNNNNNNNSSNNNKNSINVFNSLVSTNQHKDSSTLTPKSNSNASSIHATEMTPQSQKKTDGDWNSCSKCCVKSDMRACPLPLLSWANAKDVWRFMCDKDKRSSLDRNANMLQNHQGLQPRMRAILLDWLNEVCEVYKLHRETYYLALDYLDRYLSTNVSISKTYLQLIGITCLFIAAKVEEIYPPKLSEFAYVTDGACSEEDILKQELVILSALKWQTSPVTIIGWLGIYMQLNVSNRASKNADAATLRSASKKTTDINASQTNDLKSPGVNDGFVFPQFSGMEYAQIAQLIDLCTLDVAIANFSYSVIAAAAISHTFSKKIAMKLSGLDWQTISPCYRWMEPYFQICIRAPKLSLLEKHEQLDSKNGLGKVCPNINTDDSHIIQMHTTNMDMFDEAMLYREQCFQEHLQEASPAPPRTNFDHICVTPDGLLTPPDSSRKFIETH